MNEIKTRGQWFLPNNVSNKKSGELIFHPQNELTLLLDASLLSVSDNNKVWPGFTDIRESHDVINGNTEIGKISILRAFITYAGSVIKYTGQYLLIGKHYSSIDEIHFSFANVEIDNLRAWLNPRCFIVDPPFTSNSPKIEIKTPGTISLYNSRHISYSLSTVLDIKHNLEISLKPKCRININSILKNGISFLETLEKINVFEQFLTLLTSYPCFAYDLKFKDAKSDISLYFNRQTDNKNNENSAFFFISYIEIKDSIKEIYGNWIEKWKKLESVSSILVDSILHQDRFSYNSFLNIVQGIETFHRRFRKIDGSIKKDMIDEILEVCPEKYKAWLTDRIGSYNQPSLQDRLNNLFSEIEDVNIKELMGDMEEFVRSVLVTRNYYTHFDSDKKSKALKGKELFRAKRILEFILLINVLKEIGVDQDLLSKSFDRLKYSNFYEDFYSKPPVK
ncbi:HEPN domain-containing protein [Roseivirga sp. BDSF3-8]|uniref:HEPN domain-containing protein n=1 Tax=Roseivirga sp. BDSF3-8 TaxID=3241598 RepID=UPI003532483C